MTTLEDLKTYCKGKRIIIVGNSSSLLNGSHRKIIDSYNVVVRINRGYFNTALHYSENVGSKTNILSIGVQTAAQASTIVGSNSVNYILSPIMYSEELGYPNAYNVSQDTYNTLKKSLGNNKPSTGISTYNFFNRFINFTRLDLIGFDFFETSVSHRNQLGHIKVSDHDGNKEKSFFLKTLDPDKTMLHKTMGGSSIPTTTINNIPRHTMDNQFFFKNNRRRI
tara:strand:+ start:55 stop:723 length:669 start_codon:yes stop_codon:yes gene_type:complete